MPAARVAWDDASAYFGESDYSLIWIDPNSFNFAWLGFDPDTEYENAPHQAAFGR